MHIPDGYIGPLISLGASAATLPTWGVAARRVRTVLDNKTIPLLAIFAALSFTIMMFNIPVPGGTTAHGVGAALIAVVLGPWAAVIAVSVALIIQALFFGDGGVLAIFLNCFNMGIAIPFVAYASYRIIGARAGALSERRIVAGFIGGYLGMTVSAVLVGLELGIQPLLFTDANGVALYSPYGLREAIPAMLVSHLFGASIVEGMIAALGIAWFQRRDAAALASGAPDSSDDVDLAIDLPTRNPWRLAGGLAVASVAAILVFGLVAGGGDPARLFGADWSQVDWPSVATMLLFVAVAFAILVPLAHLVLPRAWKRSGTALVALAVVAPLGLIAPGFAYGEGSAEDVEAAFGYVPAGLRQFSELFSAPLAGYNLPLPFFDGANAALWHAALGYEITGILGMLLTAVAVLGAVRLLARREAGATGAGGGAGEGGVGAGWVENTLSGITGGIERAIFTEQHARLEAFLQAIDARAKLGAFVALVLAASLTRSYAVLAVLYALTLAAAFASRIPADFFVRRVWLGIPLFAGIVVLPAIFFVPGPRLAEWTVGPLTVAPSLPGVLGALLLVARVAVSVSLAVLLVMTTPWAEILRSLRAMRVPQVFVLVLSMTYRYIFLFLHTVNGLFLARKSRIVARTGGAEQRRWIGSTVGALLGRSFKMSNDVYAAMLARGFSGEMRTLAPAQMRARDWFLVAGSAGIAIVLLLTEGLASR